MGPNIKDIKQSYNIEDVLSQHLNLKRQGTQLVGNCPFHSDTHDSLKISAAKQNFKCFVTSCGAGGDLIDFFTLQGKTIPEAINIITNGSITTPVKRVAKPVNKWINATPDQNRLPAISNIQHAKYDNSPSRADAYHDENGNIVGYACRFDLPEGKKDVLPYFFKQQINPDKKNLGNPIWKWSEPDKPRLIYNLHKLIQRPDSPVLILEGEKTCDAAELLFPEFVCIAWMGGADNVKYTNWKVIENRNVFMWPDNDIPGIQCMFGGWAKNDVTSEYKRVTGITELVKANFKRINNDISFPKKWDVADANWNIEEANKYLNTHIGELPTISEFPPNELPPAPMPPTEPEPLEPIEPAPDDHVNIIPKTPNLNPTQDSTDKNFYFKCLGFENHDQNLYVFFVYRTNVIVKLSASGISVSNLLQLAPLNYWEGAYPKSTKSGSVKFDINSVADNLITKCSLAGMFNPDKIRGRGAWIDNKRTVMHCGDILIVDGKQTKFEDHKSKFIYEAGQELGFNLVKPLEKQEAYKLVQVLERLKFKRTVDARLLAGWIVTAPFCGALDWRSHLWLTGASGNGKSEVMKMFVKRFMGEMLVDAQSETSAAGIRQYLKADALPVAFDEAESEDKKGEQRMQEVVALARSSSTSNGGKIIKGSSGGSATQFNMRSSFALASIKDNLTHRSDVSRFTVIELETDHSEDKQERWKETLELYTEIFTDEYIERLQSRTLLNFATLLKNAKTFSAAAAIVLSNQRTGDQLGTTLAGSYSLFSDGEISFEDAKNWISERKWEDEKLMNSTRDEVRLINKIMDTEVKVDTIEGSKVRTIGELVMICTGRTEPDVVRLEAANMSLRRAGLKTEGDAVVISYNSDFIRKSLENTQFSNNYHTILTRVDYCIKMDPTTFASGVKSRAVKIDAAIIFQDSDEEIEEREVERMKNAEIEANLFGG